MASAVRVAPDLGKVGREFIEIAWTDLQQRTREALQLGEGFDGQGRPPTGPAGSGKLETALGILAGAARVPAERFVGRDPGWLRAEFERAELAATSASILGACETVLQSTQWRDPVFLRTCLEALQARALYLDHQADVARRSTRRRGARRQILSTWRPAFIMSLSLMVFSAPVLAASVAAVVSGLFGFLERWMARADNVANQVAWHRAGWLSFGDALDYPGTGRGLTNQLRALSDAGADVPSVAFDLCAALEISQGIAAPCFVLSAIQHGPTRGFNRSTSGLC